MTYILAIDQGTTSSRAIVFDGNLQIAQTIQIELQQYYPQSGLVEHDAEEIKNSVFSIAQKALQNFDIKAIGITNQRETTIIWDRHTGKPIHRAIVWQDRRTTHFCENLKKQGYSKMLQDTTGLLIDPYFSASKIAWLLDTIAGARERAINGDLLFGTVDSFLVWHLTDGKHHVTDATNAARTMLYDIHSCTWSKEICEILDIPMQMLPEVKDCSAEFGQAKFLADIPILGIAGDQQAATIGQGCLQKGMMKATYGTGCFALLNTGEKPQQSSQQLLTTIAYQFDGKPTYALEGSIFIAGAVVQWLRDELGLMATAESVNELAEKADSTQNIIMIPAFTGLGAPYWQPHCRGSIFGLTRATTSKELAKAALEAVGFQTRDLIEAIKKDCPDLNLTHLKVDGGMSASDYTMQFIADTCHSQIERPKVLETTALGVAWLAGERLGLYPGKDEFMRQRSTAENLEKNLAPKPIEMNNTGSGKKQLPQLCTLLLKQFHKKISTCALTMYKSASIALAI